MTRTAAPGLTRTEQRVAELVAEGLTNPQIAARLYVSRRTVQSHVLNAFDKLGVRSRTELALLCAQPQPEPDERHPGLYAVSWIDQYGTHTVEHLSWQWADGEFCRRRDMPFCYRVRIAAEDGA